MTFSATQTEFLNRMVKRRMAMITGFEVDMVVSDSLKALDLVEQVFGGDAVRRLEVTSMPKGQNEAVFTLYGVRVHMLDENPEFQMVAPKPGDAQPVWFNVAVPDIKATYARALAAGCTEVQPVTEMPAMGAANAMFTDPFGYTWLLHQIYREVSFEERTRIMEEEMQGGAG